MTLSVLLSLAASTPAQSEHSHIALGVVLVFLGFAAGVCVMAWFCAADHEEDDQREADASCANLRVDVAIPAGLAAKMWKNIEPRLPK